MLQTSYICVILLLILCACGSGAVQFAPTAPPPDLSPLTYQHPSAAFQVVVPRTWALYEQNTTALASAAFAATGAEEPSVLFVVMNTGEPLDSESFGALIDRYQTQVRPDVDRYVEHNRQAMGDGSWRMTGIRHTPLGETQQVNTFMERAGSFIGIIDVIVPEDETRRQELQAIVNTFAINEEAGLERAPLTSLTVASATSLSVLHVATWTTPAGVFFITGEVANYGTTPVSAVPVRAILKTADGLAVADASDVIMGYGIAPGAFAPFSLRFGQGQPSLSTVYDLMVGGGDWTPDEDVPFVGPEALTWTDESFRGDNDSLIIRGSVTNISSQPVHQLRAIATVFDGAQRVVAAGWNDVPVDTLEPGASADFQIVIPEMGAEPANYIAVVQGLTET